MPLSKGAVLDEMWSWNKKDTGLWEWWVEGTGDLEHSRGRRVERGRKMRDGKNSTERGRKDDGISLLCFCLRLIWTQNRWLQVSVWFSFNEESMYFFFFKEMVYPNKKCQRP